jgi:hypothetical protein
MMRIIAAQGVYIYEESLVNNVANPWGYGAALFLISPRSVGKRGNTSTVVGHRILKYKLVALVKTLA